MPRLYNVLCGQVFRGRLRQFPALVSCCTLDWYSEWPRAALRSVANHFFTNMPELDTTADVLDAMVVSDRTRRAVPRVGPGLFRPARP